jgi:excisionase family DNA binding protein
MSQLSTGLSRQEKRAPSFSAPPLAVPPREASRLLSVGMSRLYQLMRTGELESYRDGRSRRITMASIQKRMARQIAASAGEWRQIAPRPPGLRGKASKARK